MKRKTLILCLLSTLLMIIPLANSVMMLSAETVEDLSLEPEEEPVHLNLLMMASAGKEGADEVTDRMNELSAEKLNITVDLQFIGYGSYAQQVNLMLSSGEGVDVLPIYLTPLHSVANSGQILPLDDLLATYGQGIIDVIGMDFIQAGKIDGEIYGITTGRDLAASHGFEMRKDLCDKYGIDYEAIDDLDKLYDALKIIQENEPDIIPVVPSNGELVRNWGWDALGDQLLSLGVLMNMGQDNTDVVNLFATEEYKAFVTRMRQWYNEGLIMQDAVNVTENVGTLMGAGRAFGGFMNLKPGFDVQESRNYGVEIVSTEIIPAFTTTANVNMATWGIAGSTNYPEASMKYLNMMYTDSDFVNTYIYGIEDVHYKVIGEAANDQSIIDYADGLDATTSPYRPSGGWLWPNQHIGHVWAGNPAEYWENEMEFNNTAIKSMAFGFNFDPTPVRNEMTACTNVVNKYHKALMCGAVDPETNLPLFLDELSSNGIDRIIEEKQTQLNEWLAMQESN